MAQTVAVYAHIEPGLKEKVEARLSEEGMTLEAVIVQLCERIADGCGDLSSSHVPNIETAEALAQAESGQGLVEYAGLDDLKAEFS